MLLILCLVLQSIVYAAPVFVKPSFGVNSRLPINLKIPITIASIEDHYNAPNSDKTIILIQDAHTNESGQINIATTLDHILKQQRISNIFLEAGNGDLSLSDLRNKASLERRREVGLKYIKKGLLQGSEYFDMTTEHEFKLWGVEDMQLYEESLAIYREVVKHRDEFKVYLSKIKSTTDFLKTKIYNSQLQAFDVLRQSYANQDISLINYLNSVGAYQQRRNLGDLYPTLQKVQKLHKLEAAINFELANTEYDNLRLLRSARTPVIASASTPVMARSASDAAILPSNGIINSVKRYSPQNKTNSQDMNLESLDQNDNQYPNLTKYKQYIQQTKKLNANKIISELKDLEDRVEAQLSHNQDEVNLSIIAKNLTMLTNLIDLQIQPEQYQRLISMRPTFDLKTITGFVNQKILELKDHQERAIYLEQDLQKIIEISKRFYDLTLQRDQVFIHNTIQQMNTSQNKAAILITGGFHTSNIAQQLKKQGISYLSIRPAISQETNHQNYETILLSQTASTLGLKPAAELGAALSKQQIISELTHSNNGTALISTVQSKKASRMSKLNEDELWIRVGRLTRELRESMREFNGGLEQPLKSINYFLNPTNIISLLLEGSARKKIILSEHVELIHQQLALIPQMYAPFFSKLKDDALVQELIESSQRLGIHSSTAMNESDLNHDLAQFNAVFEEKLRTFTDKVATISAELLPIINQLDSESRMVMNQESIMADVKKYETWTSLESYLRKAYFEPLRRRTKPDWNDAEVIELFNVLTSLEFIEYLNRLDLTDGASDRVVRRLDDTYGKIAPLIIKALLSWKGANLRSEFIEGFKEFGVRYLNHPDVLIRRQATNTLTALNRGYDAYLMAIFGDQNVQTAFLNHFDKINDETSAQVDSQSFRQLLDYMLRPELLHDTTAVLKDWIPKIVAKMSAYSTVAYYLNKKTYLTGNLLRLIEIDPLAFNNPELIQVLIKLSKKAGIGDFGADHWVTLQMISEEVENLGGVFDHSIYTQFQNDIDRIKSIKQWAVEDQGASQEYQDKIDRFVEAVRNSRMTSDDGVVDGDFNTRFWSHVWDVESNPAGSGTFDDGYPPEFIEWINAQIDSHIEISADPYRIIDIGSGRTLHVAKSLFDKFSVKKPSLEVHTIDIATEEHIDIFKQGRPIHYEQAHIDQGTSYENSYFDIAVTSVALSYMQDREAAVRETMRILNEKGKALYILHHPKSRFFTNLMHNAESIDEAARTQFRVPQHFRDHLDTIKRLKSQVFNTEAEVAQFFESLGLDAQVITLHDYVNQSPLGYAVTVFKNTISGVRQGVKKPLSRMSIIDGRDIRQWADSELELIDAMSMSSAGEDKLNWDPLKESVKYIANRDVYRDARSRMAEMVQLKQGMDPGSLHEIVHVRDSNTLSFGRDGIVGEDKQFTDHKITVLVTGFLQYLELNKQLGVGQAIVIGGDQDRKSTPKLLAAIAWAITHYESVTNEGASMNLMVDYQDAPIPAMVKYTSDNQNPLIFVAAEDYFPETMNGLKFFTKEGILDRSEEKDIADQIKSFIEDGEYWQNHWTDFNEDGDIDADASKILGAPKNNAYSNLVDAYQQIFTGNQPLTNKKIILATAGSSTSSELIKDVLTHLGANVIEANWSNSGLVKDFKRVADLDLENSFLNQYDDYYAIISISASGEAAFIIDENGHLYRGDALGIAASSTSFMDKEHITILASTNSNSARSFVRGSGREYRVTSPYAPDMVSEIHTILHREDPALFITGILPDGGMIIANSTHPAFPAMVRDGVTPLLALLVEGAQTKISTQFEGIPSVTGRISLWRRGSLELMNNIYKFVKMGKLNRRGGIYYGNSQVFMVNATGRVVESLSFGSELGSKAIKMKATLDNLFNIANNCLNQACFEVERIDYSDGLRIRFSSGDVVHIRSSTNPFYANVYVYTKTDKEAKSLMESLIKTDGILEQLAFENFLESANPVVGGLNYAKFYYTQPLNPSRILFPKLDNAEARYNELIPAPQVPSDYIPLIELFLKQYTDDRFMKETFKNLFGIDFDRGKIKSITIDYVGSGNVKNGFKITMLDKQGITLRFVIKITHPYIDSGVQDYFLSSTRTRKKWSEQNITPKNVLKFGAYADVWLGGQTSLSFVSEEYLGSRTLESIIEDPLTPYLDKINAISGAYQSYNDLAQGGSSVQLSDPKPANIMQRPRLEDWVIIDVDTMGRGPLFYGHASGHATYQEAMDDVAMSHIFHLNSDPKELQLELRLRQREIRKDYLLKMRLYFNQLSDSMDTVDGWVTTVSKYIFEPNSIPYKQKLLILKLLFQKRWADLHKLLFQVPAEGVNVNAEVDDQLGKLIGDLNAFPVNWSRLQAHESTEWLELQSPNQRLKIKLHPITGEFKIEVSRDGDVFEEVVSWKSKESFKVFDPNSLRRKSLPIHPKNLIQKIVMDGSKLALHTNPLSPVEYIHINRMLNNHELPYLEAHIASLLEQSDIPIEVKKSRMTSTARGTGHGARNNNVARGTGHGARRDAIDEPEDGGARMATSDSSESGKKESKIKITWDESSAPDRDPWFMDTALLMTSVVTQTPRDETRKIPHVTWPNDNPQIIVEIGGGRRASLSSVLAKQYMDAQVITVDPAVEADIDTQPNMNIIRELIQAWDDESKVNQVDRFYFNFPAGINHSRLIAEKVAAYLKPETGKFVMVAEGALDFGILGLVMNLKELGLSVQANVVTHTEATSALPYLVHQLYGGLPSPYDRLIIQATKPSLEKLALHQAKTFTKKREVLYKPQIKGDIHYLAELSEEELESLVSELDGWDQNENQKTYQMSLEERIRAFYQSERQHNTRYGQYYRDQEGRIAGLMIVQTYDDLYPMIAGLWSDSIEITEAMMSNFLLESIGNDQIIVGAFFNLKDKPYQEVLTNFGFREFKKLTTDNGEVYGIHYATRIYDITEQLPEIIPGNAAPRLAHIPNDVGMAKEFMESLRNFSSAEIREMFKAELSIFLYGLYQANKSRFDGRQIAIGSSVLSPVLSKDDEGNSILSLSGFSVGLDEARVLANQHKEDEKSLRQQYVQGSAIAYVLEQKELGREYQAHIHRNNTQDIAKGVQIKADIYDSNLSPSELESQLELLIVTLANIHRHAPNVNFYLDKQFNQYQEFINSLLRKHEAYTFISIGEAKEDIILTLDSLGATKHQGVLVDISPIQSNELPFGLSNVIYQGLMELDIFTDRETSTLDFTQYDHAELTRLRLRRNANTEEPITTNQAYIEVLSGLASIIVRKTHIWTIAKPIPVEYVLKAMQRTILEVSRSS